MKYNSLKLAKNQVIQHAILNFFVFIYMHLSLQIRNDLRLVVLHFLDRIKSKQITFFMQLPDELNLMISS